MSVETLCLLVVCSIPMILVVGGGALAVGYVASRFFGSGEDEEWDEFERSPSWERDY